MKRALFTFFLLTLFHFSMAQVGGERTYSFLNLPTSARSGAMGGDFISVRDGDANLVTDNPATLHKSMDQHIGLSYINYIGDVNFGYVNYVKHYSKIGTFNAGLQYINYGKFTRTDISGNKQGSFNAGEYAFDVSMSREIDSVLTLGGSFKVIYSALADYNSFGLALDFGAHYRSRSKLFTAGLAVNNMGSQIKPYVSGKYESLPFEIQLGASYKLEKAPLRFTILASNLQQWDLTTDRGKDDIPTINSTNNLNVDKKNEDFITFDKVMRHLVIGSEIIVSKNFNIRFAYNYQRRQELKLKTSSGLTGLSFGLGFKIKKIHFSYALATYHAGGYSNHFTVTSNLREWKRKG